MVRAKERTMGAYGADGWSTAQEERALGFDGSPDGENERQERAEELACAEAARFEPVFAEYLMDHESWRGGPAGDTLASVFRTLGPDWQARVQIQRAAVLRDWVAYRTSTATLQELEDARPIGIAAVMAAVFK